MNWKVLIEKDELGVFVATVPSLPGCISQGSTKKEALENIKEAITLHLTSLAEDGVLLKTNKNSEYASVTI